MGAVEVWLYREGYLTIKALGTAGYIGLEKSIAFPSVSVVQLYEWIERREAGTDLTVIKAVRPALGKGV